MPPIFSPLDTLIAFAIVLTVGILSTISLSAYIEKLKRESRRSARTDAP